MTVHRSSRRARKSKGAKAGDTPGVRVQPTREPRGAVPAWQIDLVRHALGCPLAARCLDAVPAKVLAAAQRDEHVPDR